MSPVMADLAVLLASSLVANIESVQSRCRWSKCRSQLKYSGVWMLDHRRFADLNYLQPGAFQSRGPFADSVSHAKRGSS